MSQRRPAAPGGPDGMTFGADRLVYIAVYGTIEIRVLNKEGKVIDKLLLEGNPPTNYGLAGNGNLIVTEAERGELLEIKF